ncbi:MAG: helix-turn-helix transcriptional regulator [Clostridia bacterium]|jgi:transcriptional regulator with XRE-family HTH domain|nr:helix-turn-helix transcriptional regulator [Clostridia bacterium]
MQYMKCKGAGAIIKQLRKNKNLSQAELGKNLGFSARTISDWESGNTEPNISTIKALVKFFDISYEEFFEEI